jgi:hypothetical protein
MREKERRTGESEREAIMTRLELLPVDRAFVFTLKYDLYFSSRRSRGAGNRGRGECLGVRC